ncbi:MAG: FAD-binding oxidoreductase [Nitrospirales bacterium]
MAFLTSHFGQYEAESAIIPDLPAIGTCQAGWARKLFQVLVCAYEKVVIRRLNPLHFTAMSPSRYTAQIDQIRDLAPNVRELTLRLVEPGPERLQFHSGQSVAIEISSFDHQVPTVRYYSLASSSKQATRLTLLLSLADQGDGATYLFQQSEGAIVKFHGPHGSFYLQDHEDKHTLFVATGTGISPFLSMLDTLFEQPRSNPVTLYWGLRSERDLYYQDELYALADQHPCFSFITTLSRAHQEWAGASGRVTELVKGLPSVENLVVYVCGHQAMVDEVTKIVNKKGHCPIYREQC